MEAKEFLKKHLGTNFSPDTPFRYKNVLALMEAYHQAKMKEILPSGKIELSAEFKEQLNADWRRKHL